jgi:hypothetical protein
MLSLRGGARVGWLKATWPFATLMVQRNKIELNVALIGKYSFSQDQVISIEKYTILRKLSWGIKIIHTRSEYPKLILFRSSSDLDSIINRIREIGFQPTADPSKRPKFTEMPVKWESIVWMIFLLYFVYYLFAVFTS